MTTRFPGWLAGMLLTAHSIDATTLYVDLNSPNPTPLYTNWARAASYADTSTAGAGVFCYRMGVGN